MSTQDQTSWLRKSSLIVAIGEEGLDLSEMHFKFHIQDSDEQSPNTATIRVYNLAAETVKQIQGEYTRVILNAGYQNGNYGVIFDGTIKQFRRGRENATDTYLDILAAHGDIEYNFSVISKTIAAGATDSSAIINTISEGMNLPVDNKLGPTGGVLPRGKVLWGMNRDLMRQMVRSQGATWSIQNGRIQVIPLTGYLPTEAVLLTANTGMIGLPEQTDEGIKVRSLLNPKLDIGGTVKIDNSSINQTSAQGQNALPVGQLAYNQNAAVQFLADVTNDGLYRLYVVEHIGDSRGQEWYSDMICLAVDQSIGQVKAY